MKRSALVLAALLSAFASSFAQLPPSAVTGAPYSATETTQLKQTVAGSEPVERTRQAKIYRDSQGRVRTETMTTGDDGQANTVISIFDPVAGFVAVLNPKTETGMKNALPPSGEGHPKAPGVNAPQTQDTDLGSKTIAGLACTGKRTVITIAATAKKPAAEVVREVWTSTALKVAVQSKSESADPRFGTSTMELSNVSQTEPDAKLFQIPANFTVNTPANQPGK